MIASVRGTVLAIKADAAIVEVGGVGLHVHATPSMLAPLRVGREATIPTQLVVREDALTLYGFFDEDERDMFVTLQTVSGFGPRLALAMIAVHRPDTIRRAVAQEDLATLTKVPGVGKKSAQRLVLELADKLGPVIGQADEILDGAAPVSQPGSADNGVLDALVGLGWNPRQADEAVSTVLSQGEVAADDVAAVLRASLQILGRRG